MKTGSFLGLAVLLAGGWTAQGQQPVNAPSQPAPVLPAVSALPVPARTHNLGLDVALDKQGGNTHNADEREAGHVGRVVEQKYGNVEALTVSVQSTKLQATVHNLGPTPDIVTLECYFIGERVVPPEGAAWPPQPQKPSREFVFDHPTQTLTIPAGAATTVSVESVEVRSLVYKTASNLGGISSKKENATLPRGWLVRLVADGKVLAVRGSGNAYEELGKDQAKLDDFLAFQPPSEDRYRRTVGPFRKKQ